MDEKRKVIILAGQLVVGGAERQLYLWLTHMDRGKYEPVVVTFHPGEDDYWEKPIKELGIPLFHIPQTSKRWLRLCGFVSIVRSIKPDLIHSWHLFPSPYAGIAAGLQTCKSISGFRGSFDTFVTSGLMGKMAISLTDAMIVNSITTASRLRSAYPHKAKQIFSVQNAVIEEFLDRCAARKYFADCFNLDPQKKWVGSMGRLDPKKRFDFLLQAIARIKDDSFNLILIGDGPEKHKLLDLSDELSILQRVCFTGEIPRASRFMKAFDIFAFTSVDEGLPNVILEAGAAGIPVITWDLPFYREVLLQDRCLVAPGDVEKFASTLTSLLANPQTASEIGSMTSQMILNSFDLDHYIENMTSVYDSLLIEESPSNRSKV